MTATPGNGNSDASVTNRKAFNPMLIAVGVLAIAVVALAFYVFQLPRSIGQAPVSAQPSQTAAQPKETILTESTDSKLTADQIVLKMIEAQTVGDDAQVEQYRLQLDRLPKQARGDKKTARSLNDAGLKALQNGNTDLAIRAFSEAQKSDVSDPEIANNLAHALVKNDRLVDASVAVLESLQLDSARSAAWGTLALIYAKTGSPERASASFQIAFRYSRSSQGTVSYLQNLIESDADANVRQSASLAMQSTSVKNWLDSHQVQPSNSNEGMNGQQGKGKSSADQESRGEMYQTNREKAVEEKSNELVRKNAATDESRNRIQYINKLPD